MKVLFVYKYLTLGGVEAVLRTRLDGLGDWGLEAHVWFLGDHGGRSLFAGLGSRFHIGSAQELGVFLSHSDVRIVSTIDTEEVFPYFARGGPVPRLVVETHTTYMENLDYLRQTRTLPVAGFFAPTAMQAKLVATRIPGIDRVTVVPNPVRQIFIDESDTEVVRPPRQVVAWIGRLDEHKNWRGFLDVAALLADLSFVEWWIVGDSIDPGVTRALARHASDLGVIDRLRWLRKVRHDRMPGLLDAVRESGGATLTTSRAESFGLTVIEAMARGCTVVVPDSEPFTDYVTHGANGRCYEPGSAQDAARHLRAVLLDAEARATCGGAARRVILERYAPGPVLAVLARELRELSS